MPARGTPSPKQPLEHSTKSGNDCSFVLLYFRHSPTPTLLSRVLAVLSGKQIQHQFRAIEIQKLDIFLHPTIEREAHFPGPRKYVWVLDRSLIHYVIRTDLCIALDHMESVAMVIPRAIKP